MKKVLAALLIATLIIGTFLSMVTASATSAVLSANDDEDEHEPEEENDVIGDEESNEDHEEGTGEQERSEESGAEEAKHLAERAKHLAEEALGKAGETEHSSEEEDEEEEVADDEEEEEEAEDAMEAIREAEEQILKASSKIEEVKEKGLDTTDVESLLVRADNTLSGAKAAYGEGNYEEAEQLAEEAKHLAKKAKHLAEDILGKSGETEHSGEEEDGEEHEELGSDVDEEGDLHVTSRDNTIEFEKDKPKIDFEYVKNGTKIKFSADDFALVEFYNSEIKQWLKFDEIVRDVTFEETDEGEIIVTYYASTTGYEITIIMHVYQKSVTRTSSTWDATVVFDVDGGADEVKFDLIVTRWTWAPEADADSSQLALFMNLEAEVEGEIALESASVDEDQIVVKLGDIGIKVSWVKTAEVDGGSVPVTVTYESVELEQEGEAVELQLDVYFMYPYFGENQLIHDPSIGIEDDPILHVFTLITPELLLGTGITAIAIVAVAVALTRRRKLSPLESGAPPL